MSTVRKCLITSSRTAHRTSQRVRQCPASCRDELLALAGFARGVVFVSDYIYSDAARYDEFTENYRRSLASVDAALAKVCGTVIELCAGNVVYHKRPNSPDFTLADSTADTARGCLPC